MGLLVVEYINENETCSCQINKRKIILTNNAGKDLAKRSKSSKVVASEILNINKVIAIPNTASVKLSSLVVVSPL